MILVLALLSLRRFFCLDLGLCIIAVDCVKRWKEWGEAGGEGRVRGGLPLNCDQNTILVESDISELNPLYQEVIGWDLPMIGGIATELAGIGSQVQQLLRSIVGLTIIRSQFWPLVLNR